MNQTTRQKIPQEPDHERRFKFDFSLKDIILALVVPLFLAFFFWVLPSTDDFKQKVTTIATGVFVYLVVLFLLWVPSWKYYKLFLTQKSITADLQKVASIITDSNPQKIVDELKLVIPKTATIVHQLDALCGLFLKEVPGRCILRLNTLTSIEEALPSQSEVVIKRPVKIGLLNDDELTSIMINNASRGIKYWVAGEVNWRFGYDMPIQWKDVKTLEVKPVDEHDHSLVIPSLGLVLYIVLKSVVGENWDRLGHRKIWHHLVNRRILKGVDLWVAGFVLLPILYAEDSPEHDFLALSMSDLDVDEIMTRVFCEKK